MNLKVHIKLNSVICFCVILLICSFTVFTTYSWGRYVMLACIATIFVLDVIEKRLRYKLVFGRYLGVLALFAGYTLLSSLWAENASDAISTGRTLVEILLMMFVIFNCYSGKSDAVSNLLFAIKWSSFIVVIYSIAYYGLDSLVAMVAAEDRMQNTYANVNTIGMLAAVGAIIQIVEILREKKIKLSILFCVPSFFLVAATQSRKAFAMLLLGVFMDIVMRNVATGNMRKMIIRFVLGLIFGGIVLYGILSLPIFSGVLERMNSMLAGFMGVGTTDSSMRLRTQMIEVGLEQFLKTPIFGMGMGNAHILSARYLGADVYLHNNFIEVLAGGGIIGFSIYYSMYFYLFANFWRYRKNQNREYVICFVIMLLLLAMDYGMVSYYNKSRYIYLMLYFLEVEVLKRHARLAGTKTGCAV